MCNTWASSRFSRVKSSGFEGKGSVGAEGVACSIERLAPLPCTRMLRRSLSKFGNVGAPVGNVVGAAVGPAVGYAVGPAIGDAVGSAVGQGVEESVGMLVGVASGIVGESVGHGVGTAAMVGHPPFPW